MGKFHVPSRGNNKMTILALSLRSKNKQQSDDVTAGSLVIIVELKGIASVNLFPILYQFMLISMKLDLHLSLTIVKATQSARRF
jgi:hypothetical protein